MEVPNRYNEPNISVENATFTGLNRIKDPLTEKDVKQYHIDMEMFSLSLDDTKLILYKYLFNGRIGSNSTEVVKDSIDNLVKWVNDTVKQLDDKTTEFYSKLVCMFNVLVERNEEVITKLNKISDIDFAKKLENYLNDYNGKFSNFDSIIDGKNFIKFNTKFIKAQKLIDNIYQCVHNANTKSFSYIERLGKLPTIHQIEEMGDINTIVKDINNNLGNLYDYVFELGTSTIGFDKTTKKFVVFQSQGNVTKSVLEGTSKSSIISALSTYDKYKSNFEDAWNKKHLKEMTRIIDGLYRVNLYDGITISAVKTITSITLIGIYSNINTFASVVLNKLIDVDRALLILANGIINAPLNKFE